MVHWFNPRRGGGLQPGSTKTVTGGGFVSIGNPPQDHDRDWIALVKLDGPLPKSEPPPVSRK